MSLARAALLGTVATMVIATAPAPSFAEGPTSAETARATAEPARAAPGSAAASDLAELSTVGKPAWTQTWGAAQAAAVPNVTSGFAGFTIRNAVHTSVPGNKVRVHLSNRLGTLPVLMGHVTVSISARTGGKADGSVQYSNGSVAPGTMHDVLFAGRPSVTIPAGAEVVSDAVALAVPADQDLYVTVFTPKPSGTVTYHPATMQTNTYFDDGTDHAADIAPSGFPKETYVWHYVSGVDVSGGPGTVVAIGDSITDGVNSSWAANRRWTDYLATRLRGQKKVPRYGVSNAAISGNRILLDGAYPNYTIYETTGKSALARLGYDVLDRPGARTVIVFEGINDIQQEPHQADPEQIIAGLAQLAQQAHDRGLRVVGATIMAWNGWYSYTPQLEATRQAVNSWIRTSKTFQAVADFDAATRDPADQSRILPAFDSGDHLHPNDAGDAAIAAAVPLKKL
ncbi:MAG: hydrolase [Actinomycetia bacterium]|nr:hydrolase [Actinomycetes bacterium]